MVHAPGNILVATDLGDRAQNVVSVAASYAAAFHAKVFILHVAPPPPDLVGYPKTAIDPDLGDETPIGWDYDRQLLAEQLRAKHRAVQEMARALENDGCSAEAILAEGAFVDTLVSEIDRRRIGLVVIGSHEPSLLTDLLFGNMAKEVIGRIPCPVLVVPPFPEPAADHDATG